MLEITQRCGLIRPASMPRILRAPHNDGVSGRNRYASVEDAKTHLNELTSVSQCKERLGIASWLKENDIPDQDSPVKGRTDVHLHSNYSDGYDVPTMVVYRAWKRGLDAMALTDHDCVTGVEEALQAGNIFGVRVIPGVEIGVEADAAEYGMNSSERARADVLLYFPDAARFREMRSTTAFNDFEAKLEKAQAVWFDWIEKIRQRFNLLHLSEGLEISEEMLRASMRDTLVPTRTHLIQAGLLNLAKTTGIHESDVFLRQYLFAHENKELAAKSAYVNKDGRIFTPHNFAEIAVSLGAVSVIAHPCEYSPALLNGLIGDLSVISAGGKRYCAVHGIEVYAAKAKDDEVTKYGGFMDGLNRDHPVFSRHPLFFTAGSDSHSPIYTPKLRIGLEGRPYPFGEHILKDLVDTFAKTPVLL